ncbi:ribosome biogenesis protein BMS1 homolog [Halyomorpha halys]|uniref:ribosome biogenesis protein BMS1 homolog n=1 Tax=Halyomorpha halys TaxID=286706 RepID=UPI0006D51F82|nr:ribosome biogenesis protein BMS1 homolog [Halyomorpha halys]
MEEVDNDSKKPHRPRHSGRKAEKKKAKNPHVQELTDKQRNPKAFAITSAVRAERNFRRTQDLKRKKEHIPVVDRTPLEPPPIIVAIVGPPKVGKSLLLKCLIKSYTRQPLVSIKGPVTLVSGKKRRITFIESNNDINSMIDIAKVADLVLLLIDASFGFEMEIFEFLNICQVHGMPKIMGVLTHLDVIKKTKKVQKTKKILKHRFWKEVYPGAKLFYLSNLQNGSYLRNEIKNLARFISVMKFRPLTWQSTHSYVLADRMEDMTPPDQIQLNPKVDRDVCLYGYMRGIPMNKNCFVHIPGCGDFSVSDVSFLPDPCPLPDQIKKRSLTDKERSLYAPFSGVGGIVYDKDAIYVDMPTIYNSSKNEPESEMVSNLLESKETMDTKLAHSKVQIFTGAEPVTAEDLEEMEYEMDNVTKQSGGRLFETITDQNDGRKRRKVIFENDSEDELEKISKKLKKTSDTSGIESDDEYDFNDVDGDELLRRKMKECSDVQETPGIYKSILSDKDKELRDKISGALSLLESKTLSDDKGWSDCSSDSDDTADEGNEEETEELSVPWEKVGDQFPQSEDVSGESDADDEDDDELMDTDLNWKTNLAEKAAKAFIERQSDKSNLYKLVYGGIAQQVKSEDDDASDGEDGTIGGLFRAVKREQEAASKTKDTLDTVDCSKFDNSQMRDWSLESNIESIKDCFVTGKWEHGEDAEELLKLDELSESEEEIYGDYEDYETGEKFVAQPKAEKKKPDEPTKEELLEKKRKLKEKFDAEYDKKGDDDEDNYFDELKSEANKQAQLNRTMFEGIDDSVRVEIEGFRAGMYVRMEIKNMPCEFVDNFDPSYPLIMGSVQPGEQNIGFIKVRIKKHRWYSRILKTRDPLIISMGWRRFQTIGVFSKQEDNMRHRMLKYTPQHVACMCHFWGPLTKAGTGFLALLNSPNPEQVDPGFRITATGSVVDTNQSTVVTKKLKLIGEPIKVFKKTAFISGMFTSALEVAKFEGAKIKTVSGIRGQIKKPIQKPEGAFRATFEDKILMSDIVFCRTWYKIDVPQFYTTITTLLLPINEKNKWRGMKTLGQLKREKGIRNEAQEDSMYTEIKRELKPSRPLVIPRAVERDLPYKLKTKHKLPTIKNPGPFTKQLKKVVIRDTYESKVASLMKKLKVNYEDKLSKKKRELHQRMMQFRKQKRMEKLKKMKKHKELKKSVYRALGKMEANKEKFKTKKSKK